MSAKIGHQAGRACRTLIATLGVLWAWSGTAAAQANPLVGAGDPATDVPALQAALDAGGIVLLAGTFDLGDAQVTITRSVTLLGAAGSGDDMPTLLGGLEPVQVTAPGADVAFAGLRFRESQLDAIVVNAARSLVVAGCRFEDLVPVFAGGVGKPVSVGIFGANADAVQSVEIAENEFDVPPRPSSIANGVSTDSTNPMIFVGAIGRLEVRENRARNFTSHGIDVRGVGGDVLIAGNDLTSAPVMRDGTPGNFADGIRCLEAGSFRVENNRIRIASPNGAGIRLGGTTMAIVHDNGVTMSLPAGAVPGAQNAGIVVQGTALANTVRENTIRGSAWVALSAVHSDFGLDGKGSGNPDGTAFIDNDDERFLATFANVEVGKGARNTLIAGESGTVSDLGKGTVILRAGF
jgi:hypothetical protein